MIVDGGFIRVAGLSLSRNSDAQISGERRVGIVDGLVLADDAAQMLAEIARPRLLRRVGQDLVGLDGQRRRGEGDQRAERERLPEETVRHHRSISYSAGASAGSSPRDRRGAPTRKRRSESETKPPSAMTIGPNQIQGASGW